MDTLRIEPDAVIGEFIVEIKVRAPAIRSLREAVLTLIYQLAANSKLKALLVLVDPGLSAQRVKHEWRNAAMAFRPELFSRVSLVTVTGDRFDGLPSEFSPSMREALMEAVLAEQRKLGGGERGRDSFTEILKVLVRLWLENAGPVTTSRLGTLTGFSYPTLSTTLGRLGNGISRGSDRRVELREFPLDAWAQIVTLGERVRTCIRFADRSGQPSSTEALLGRFLSLAPKGAGVGGVAGARHYVPTLDLVGNPRLDLTIHCPNGMPDLSFVRKLDPALNLTTDRTTPISLLIHVDRCPVASFERSKSGTLIANPVECLLDLHEAKLEALALEFLNALVAKRSRTS